MCLKELLNTIKIEGLLVQFQYSIPFTFGINRKVVKFKTAEYSIDMIPEPLLYENYRSISIVPNLIIVKLN